MGKKASLRQQRKAAKAREGKEAQEQQGQEAQEVKYPQQLLPNPEPIIEGTVIKRQI